MTSPTLNRRTFLKAAGVSVALPLLECFASAAPAARGASAHDRHL